MGRTSRTLLPSRAEDAPALIEAMLCGRMPIVTDVGRASDLIDDEDHGFVAPAATVPLIDDALERAWQTAHPVAGNGCSCGTGDPPTP